MRSYNQTEYPSRTDDDISNDERFIEHNGNYANMRYAKFINRENELGYLKKELGSKDFRLIPVWGRRRVGKTRLILEATKGRSVYFLATEAAERTNLKMFREDASRELDDQTIKDLELDWEVMFRYLSKKGITIIIDEFPYLIVANRAIPSIFQRIVDKYLMGTDTKLILCGSSVRMMESKVLSYRSPLYGRRTGQLRLKPLDFSHLSQFFPKTTFENRMRVYGCCGGVPLYLINFTTDKPFQNNLENIFLNPNSFMYMESDLLLKQEFPNPSTYKSIMKEIASGKNTTGEIRKSLDMGKSDLSPYIRNLMETGLVDRKVPVTENETRSRRGRYFIGDNFFNFYFRYIHPNASMIEGENVCGVLELIDGDMDSYLGRVFESVAHQAFGKWCIDNSTTWDRVGSWWFGEDEIDLVAFSSKRNEMVFCEVKWSKRPAGRSVVEKLVERSKNVRWRNEKRKNIYMLISRVKPTKGCTTFLDEIGGMFWGIDDLERIFASRHMTRK